jgi:hypothetical protein
MDSQVSLAMFEHRNMEIKLRNLICSLQAENSCNSNCSSIIVANIKIHELASMQGSNWLFFSRSRLLLSLPRYVPTNMGIKFPDIGNLISNQTSSHSKFILQIVENKYQHI